MKELAHEQLDYVRELIASMKLVVSEVASEKLLSQLSVAAETAELEACKARSCTFEEMAAHQ